MTDELTPRLRNKMRSWAGQVTKLAHKNLGKFRRLITVQSKVVEQDDKLSIESTAKGITSRAYEYGSGIHSRLSKKSPKQISPKGKILIRPVRKKVLAFFWDVAEANPDQFVFAPDGRVLLPQVKHPGVKAANEGRGYLGPAVNEVRKQIRKELPKETREAVLATFRKSFKR